ncbi:MAG: hypothetical protein QXI39_07445 [Candidatus Bathyarchaeia archaeon]
MKVRGLQVYVWSARDVASKEVLATYVTSPMPGLTLRQVSS